MDDLKPCPFCGGKAIVKHHPEWGWEQYEVYCTQCLASFDRCFSDEEEAIDAWKRRAKDDGVHR